MNETKLLTMLQTTTEERLTAMEYADEIGELKDAYAKVCVLLTVFKQLNSRELLDEPHAKLADSMAEELRTQLLKIYQSKLEELEKCEK